MTEPTASQVPLEKGRHDRPLRQRALIDAATAVFAERGFEAATTREIAERACCSEGLIHRYFQGKRGLLLAALESKARDLAAEFTGTTDRDTLQGEIEELLLWQMRVMWERREFMRASVAQATIDSDVGRLVGRLNGQRTDLIREKLEHHRAAGRVRDRVDLEAAAQAIGGLGFLLGFWAQVVFGMPPDEVRRIAVANAATLARGLAPEPDSAAARADGP